MENIPPHEDSAEQEPVPTFEDVLQAVANGDYLGFTIFDDAGINYTFCEIGESLGPLAMDELRLPMSPQDAQDMLDGLREDDEGLEELQERGHRPADSHDSLN